MNEHLFSLLRFSLGTSPERGELSALTKSDWEAIVDLAFDQGVAALLVDGIDEATKTKTKTKTEELDFLESEELEDLRYELFGEVLVCEENYRKQKETIASLTKLYAQSNIRTLIIKGYAASKMYPKPDHRSVGDIDIYLYGKGEEGDRLMKAQGIEIRQNEDKHSTFTFDNAPVENHATFVNVVEHPSLLELENCLEQEAVTAVFDDTLGVYLPTPMADALFLSYHLAGHFVYGGASLKQVLDWVMLIKKYGKEIDWNRVLDIADRAGYGKFLRCLNGIIVTHFGIMESTFPEWERELELEERVFGEILHPEIEKRGKSLIGKVFRYFRSRWKYRIVFKESMFMTFFRRSWAFIREKYLPKSRSVWDR